MRQQKRDGERRREWSNLERRREGPYGKGWGNCQYFAGDFELRFSSNDTCPVGVHREIVINGSPRGGAIGFSTLPNPLSSPTPSHKRGSGACN
jgi:hypothetical protein